MNGDGRARRAGGDLGHSNGTAIGLECASSSGGRPAAIVRGVIVSLNLYDISLPPLERGLTNLSALIDKAAAHAAARKFDPIALVQARLYPDMLPFPRQVQIACDGAKGAAARLAGIEVPKHEDNEATLAELKQRIAKTLDFMRTVRPEQLAGAEDRAIELKFPSLTLRFTGRTYITDFVLPNFYFHVSIAYALLRHNGVEIGKQDYLGKIQ